MRLFRRAPDPDVERMKADVAALRDVLSAQVAALDARVTSVSTELANQLTELSGDLEALAKDHPPTDDVVMEIRDAQVRLANEQARYQIAFREGLTELAERLRRA